MAHVVVLGWGTAAACLAMAGQFVVRVHWFGWSGPRHHCRELPGPSVRNLQEKRAERVSTEPAGREPSLTGSGRERGIAACQPCPLVHGRMLRAALAVSTEVKHLCNLVV